MMSAPVSILTVQEHTTRALRTMRVDALILRHRTTMIQLIMMMGVVITTSMVVQMKWLAILTEWPRLMMVLVIFLLPDMIALGIA